MLRRQACKKMRNEQKTFANVNIVLKQRPGGGFTGVEKRRLKLCKVHRKNGQKNHSPLKQKKRESPRVGKSNLLFENGEQQVHEKWRIFEQLMRGNLFLTHQAVN